MAAWKRKGGLHKYYDRLVNGMIERGYTGEFAEGIYGTWQREGDVKNLIAGHLEDLTYLLGELETSSRDFH